MRRGGGLVGCRVYFIDANVPLYASGAPSSLLQPCQTLLSAIGSGTLPAATSVAVLQEVLHVSLKKYRLDGGVALVGKLMTLLEVLPVEAADVTEAMRLLQTVPGLASHDALHAAVMRRHGLTHIITADRHFAAVPGLIVLDPITAAQTLCP